MELSATRPFVLEELGEVTCEELKTALARNGVASAVIHGRARGGTSTCYFIFVRPQGSSLVLKRPNAGEHLMLEYAALCDAAARRSTLAMRLPTPVAWLSPVGGYLMERLSGVPLRAGNSLRGSQAIAASAAAILTALDSYHRELERPYGDFHAANVLVQPDGTPAFIDPGQSTDIARATAAWKDVTPTAFDLGLWLYNSALDTPSVLVTSPVAATRMFRLAVQMARTASAAGHPSDDTFRIAFRHASRLWTDPWPARRLKAPLVWLALRVLSSAATTSKVVGQP